MANKAPSVHNVVAYRVVVAAHVFVIEVVMLEPILLQQCSFCALKSVHKRSRL